MAGGDGANGGDAPAANYGPKYEAHMAEMQKQLDEAARTCAPRMSCCTHQQR
jgi:hypothetical protein